jgi:WD40 repeat protein
VLPGALGDVADVEFGRGGTLAAAGTDAIGVWDVEKGQLRESLPAGATTVAFSADGHWLASSGDDGSVRLWDIDARRQVGDPLPTPPHIAVVALAFTAPSMLAAAYRDGTAAAWDLASWRIATRLDTIARRLRRAIGKGGGA